MNNAERTERHVLAWVDDDKDYRAVVREWLEPHYDVREYGEAQTLLSALELMTPDALLLDVSLPDGDGFSLCRRIRERGVDAPVLFLTSSADQDDYLRHLELGATGYLMKPIGRHQLLARLSEIVDGERTRAGSHWKEAPGWMPGNARKAVQAPGRRLRLEAKG